jgi:hypothetical protein
MPPLAFSHVFAGQVSGGREPEEGGISVLRFSPGGGVGEFACRGRQACGKGPWFVIGDW